MRDAKRKDDEMLIVHKPAPTTGLAAGAIDPGRLPADVPALARRLNASQDAAERSALLAAIQARFGNAHAQQVIDAARSVSPDGGDS